MPQSEFRLVVSVICAELGRALSQVEEEEVGQLREALTSARAIFVTGEGRSGLVARAFAMRLMHLGLRAYVVGETTTPAAQPDDLLVAISGSGETCVTRTHAASAKTLGLTVAALTAVPESPLGELCDLRVLIPSESEQYGGSLFEQAALVLLDALALLLQRRLGQRAADLNARHATLE